MSPIDAPRASGAMLSDVTPVVTGLNSFFTPSCAAAIVAKAKSMASVIAIFVLFINQFLNYLFYITAKQPVLLCARPSFHFTFIFKTSRPASVAVMCVSMVSGIPCDGRLRYM